ncbi:MAG: type II toxin-antitoxin system VapC family toxin [Blastochloris sp.]|nr:type II toxin-antitoxin system VapC family toxin [Blastochloris sp.]
MTPLQTYADSSFLLSLNVEDGNTKDAGRFISRHPSLLPFNPLHRLEVSNGLRLQVWRGQIDPDRRKSALRQIEEDLSEGLLVHVPLPWTEALRKAEQLSAAHAEKLGCRSADTLHVAAALLAGAKHFLSFDKRQRELAKAAGLEVKP